ncbi:circadian clock KaiB family protein [Pedobacter miscanthi]|uniref:Circadian clock protein KaiB n=1 Tax=Pedobacter miscanthi TaxID=2259170 RepID=A0A366L8T7_9SPHI|nr:circadian clock KaiB family protein [Pedobacter miscanthi]RBQ09889.1 circadian clock protein KaiB [Pedobacter miscanthi]
MEDNGSLNPDNGTAGEHFNLRLFIAGSSPVSARAIKNIRDICEEFLKNRYTLEIIDAHQQPLLVRDENVTAIPMLIKKTPSPKKRLIGDFSNLEKVLIGLGIR